MNRYQELFDRYVNELSAAKASTDVWWQRLVDAEVVRGATLQEAEERVRERWPMGSAGHPLVLAAYRKHYIACEQLNTVVAAAYVKKMKEEAARGEGEWGVEDADAAAATESSDDWGPEWQIDPPALLVDRLFGRRDDLADFMMSMVFSPIGEEDDRSV